jgi:cytochrome d ubiquinol oxidase subunit I
MELTWNTNEPGTGAPFAVVAWPQAGGGSNAAALEIPNALSILTTHSDTGTVLGLNSFPADDQPTVVESVFIFYAFRLMVLIGVVLVALTLFGVWYWYAGQLSIEKISKHMGFWRLWIYAIPLGFIATEAGWMVREIGRQPWIMYHVMRTADGLSSNLESPVTALVIGVITAVYCALLWLFIYFTRRIVQSGPDLTSPLP